MTAVLQRINAARPNTPTSVLPTTKTLRRLRWAEGTYCRRRRNAAIRGLLAVVQLGGQSCWRYRRVKHPGLAASAAHTMPLAVPFDDTIGTVPGYTNVAGGLRCG